MKNKVDPKVFLETSALTDTELYRLSRKFKDIFLPLGKLLQQYNFWGKKELRIYGYHGDFVDVKLSIYFDEPIDVVESGINYIKNPKSIQNIFNEAKKVVIEEIEKIEKQIYEQHQYNIRRLEEIKGIN